jgi:hypothetical protein
MKRVRFLWFLVIAICLSFAGSQLAVAADSSSIKRVNETGSDLLCRKALLQVGL